MPREVHEHEYDDEGRLVRTVVTREPEWDDESRAEMLALAEYDAGICACGFHESLTQDRRNFFTFEHRVCPVCAGRAQWDRKVADADDHIKVDPHAKPEAPLPTDGRWVGARMLGPAEKAALERPKPGPERPA